MAAVLLPLAVAVRFLLLVAAAFVIMGFEAAGTLIFLSSVSCEAAVFFALLVVALGDFCTGTAEREKINVWVPAPLLKWYDAPTAAAADDCDDQVPKSSSS